MREIDSPIPRNLMTVFMNPSKARDLPSAVFTEDLIILRGFPDLINFVAGLPPMQISESNRNS